MVKPKRLLYPTQLIDKNVAILQRNLRRLFRQYRKHEINKLQALTDGELLIKQAFEKAEEDIKKYLIKHNLVFSGDQSELENGLIFYLEKWQHIVKTF